MEMHHLGSGIWSQMRLSTGAILRVTVPATIMRSRLARAGPEDLGAEARDIEARGAGGDHLDGAAGQTERERPDGRFARPVEHVIHARW